VLIQRADAPHSPRCSLRGSRGKASFFRPLPIPKGLNQILNLDTKEIQNHASLHDFCQKHSRYLLHFSQEFVATKVQSGRYNSACEVVREALRLLEEHEQARATQIAAFNQELSQRLNLLDRGEHVNPAKARNRIQTKSAARKRLRA
jgi:antitoxin ParD1/3/4